MLHLNTRNNSALAVYKQLVKTDVKNAGEILKLLDSSLDNIDPHSKDLTEEQKVRICIEARDNPWYFYREIVKIPSTNSSPSHFRFGIVSIGAIFACIKNKDLIYETPRQEGRTTFSIVRALHSAYMKVDGKTNEDLPILPNRVSKARYIMQYSDTYKCLPDYLFPDKADSLKNGLIIPTCRNTANNSARRSVNTISYIDVPYLLNFDIFYAVNAAVWPMVKAIAKKDGLFNQNRVLLIPPVTEHTNCTRRNFKVIDKFIESAKIWDVNYLDADDATLDQITSFRAVKR